MANEMLRCPLKEFMAHYAPFCPSEESVDQVFQLYTKDKRTEPLLKKIEQDDEEDAPEGWVWADFELPPSSNKDTEPKVFESLQDIVDSLRTPEVARVMEQANNLLPQFHYRDCPSQDAVSEISGTNFRVDAYITDGPESREVVLADVAVVAEFKKRVKDIYENRRQLVSDANQIMNDDPRRMWVYGITIEDEMMSVWYFSRSHSVKSTSFNFTTDIKTFIRVFLSFIYATREEIGYDPTVHRVLYNDKTCYVYEIESQGQRKYFRTVELLFNSRVLRITGRKTRVWRAVEVDGFRDDEIGRVKNGGSEVALKDAWLDEKSETEKQILDSIFERLDKVEKKDYSWASDKLKAALDELFDTKGFKDYFMEVKYDELLQTTKPRLSSAVSAPNLLLPSQKGQMVASGNILASSMQSGSHSRLSANLINQHTGRPEVPFPRKYLSKQHYRLVYGQVGYSLHAATSLLVSTIAVRDAFIALVLLYLAGYVHRDVSTGNIILVARTNGAGGLRGKLSDLEYAKKFEVDSVSHDPKTGTPFFMALEIHSSRCLYAKLAQTSQHAVEDFDISVLADLNSGLQARHAIPPPNQVLSDGDSSEGDSSESDEIPPPPKFRFSHDLESLWWIVLWILIYLIKHPQGLELAAKVFTHDPVPSHMRHTLFMMQNCSRYLRKRINSRFAQCAVHLAEFRDALQLSYAADDIQDPMTYTKIYNDVFLSLFQLLDVVVGETFHRGDVDFELGDSQQPDIQQRKRPRTQDNNEDEYVPGTEDGEAQKRAKVEIPQLPMRYT